MMLIIKEVFPIKLEKFPSNEINPYEDTERQGL